MVLHLTGEQLSLIEMYERDKRPREEAVRRKITASKRRDSCPVRRCAQLVLTHGNSYPYLKYVIPQAGRSGEDARRAAGARDALATHDRRYASVTPLPHATRR